MRRIIIIAVALLMVVGVGSAFAATESGKVGISVGFGDSLFGKTVPPDNFTRNVVNISGRYFIAKDMAVTAGFGLQIDSSDADSTYFSFSAGFRKYLKTDDFAPFVSGKFTYATVDNDTPPPGSPLAPAEASVIDLEAAFGAEYFFSKQFSVEGAIGVGFGTLSVDDADDTYFGTRTIGVFANFYF